MSHDLDETRISAPLTTERSAMSPVLKGVIYGAIVLATAGGVYLTTRDAAAPPPAPGGHDHAAMSAGTSKAQPVSLTDDQSRRIGVTFAQATVGPFDKEVRTVGQIILDETRVHVISPKVDGWVERLYVDETGQPVVAGAPLLALYAPMLVQAQEELLLAKTLQKDMSAASGEAQGGAATLLESARRRLAYWDIPEREIAEIERTGQVHKTLTLYAPGGGYVLDKNIVAGQRIMAGEALYRIADLREVWVEGEVFEQDLADVRVGQMVHADLSALPGEHRMGRIDYVYPTVDPQTRTARIRVVLPNSEGRLKPGMYATLRIVGTARDRVLTVPRDAVLSTGERHVVFVREANGQLAPHEVAVGSANDTRIEILRGLDDGAMVVASATFLVDAESNLGKALGGMGDMPGMDMSAPPAPLPMRESGGGGAARPRQPMAMPNMPSSKPKAATKDSSAHGAHHEH